MTTDIKQLEQQYDVFTESSKEIAKGISSSISMLQLDSVKEDIARAVIQVEEVTNKGEDKPSLLAKIPGLGRFITQVSKERDETNLRQSNMVEVVDRLFNSLSTKRDNILQVSETLFNLRDRLEEQKQGLLEQEVKVREITETGTGMELMRARNLLIQISPTVTKSIDRIDVIDVTIRSAQASAEKISGMLPNLHADLITEMSIQAGLQELQEFKQVFDSTVDIVDNLSSTNNTSMKRVLLDVAELAVNKPTEKALARMEGMAEEKRTLALEIKAKLQDAEKFQAKSLVAIDKAREAQTHNLLGNSQNVYKD